MEIKSELQRRKAIGYLEGCLKREEDDASKLLARIDKAIGIGASEAKNKWYEKYLELVEEFINALKTIEQTDDKIRGLRRKNDK